MRCIIRIPLVLIFLFFLSLIFISACDQAPPQKIETKIRKEVSTNLTVDSLYSLTQTQEIRVKFLKGITGVYGGGLYPGQLETAIKQLQKRGCKLVKVNTIYDKYADLVGAEIWYYCDK